MAVETIQYRIDGGAWIDGGTGSVSLTGLSPGTMYMFEVRAKDDSDNYSGVSRKFYATTEQPAPLTNYALASAGSTITNSSSNGANYPASATINGTRHPNGTWDTPTGGWLPSGFSSPEWLEIAFNATRTIEEINVFFLRNDVNDTTAPTLIETGTSYVSPAFTVEQWDGGAWVAVTGAPVTGNDKIWRQFLFTPLSTTKIKVSFTTAGAASTVGVCEIEAKG